MYVRVRGASPPSLPPATVLATDALQTVINLDAATPFSVETNFLKLTLHLIRLAKLTWCASSQYQIHTELPSARRRNPFGQSTVKLYLLAESD